MEHASLDQALLRAVYAGDWPPAWVTVLLAVSFLGSGWMLLGLLPGFAVRSWRRWSLATLLTLALTSGAVSILKAATNRVRPCNAIAWAHTLPIDLPSDGSFPSGHAAGSFAFVMFVWGFKPKVALFLLPVACLIALSRVALGVHHPSDVAAGAALGSLIGWAAALGYRSRYRLKP
jgi:undecaprenyl-diphosphatase